MLVFVVQTVPFLNDEIKVSHASVLQLQFDSGKAPCFEIHRKEKAHIPLLSLACT